MSDISNKTIVALLTVALVVTVTGTIISVSKLSDLGVVQVDGTTAAATSESSGTGSTNLSILSVTDLSLYNATISFGSGYVNTTNSSCDTQGCLMGTNMSFDVCCTNFTVVDTGFLLENTGNENISINYSCQGSCGAAALIGGTGPTFNITARSNSQRLQQGESTTDTAVSCREWTGNVNSGGWNISLDNDGPTNGSFRLQEMGQIAVNDSAWLCGNSTSFPLAFQSTKNAGVVDLNITIPPDAPSGGGEQTATFFFSAFSNG